MQGFTIWLPPVACCMAIQGFWLGTLLILQPRPAAQDLQDLHRFSGTVMPRVKGNGLKPRV